MFKCKFCQIEKLTSHSVNAHQARCSRNPNRKTSSGNTGKIAWNKGQTKATNISLQIISKKLSNKPGRNISDEERQRISMSMKIAHKEGRAWNIGMNRWKKIPSYAEQKFLECVLNEFDNKDVKREVYLKGFVLDFYWENAKAVVEIDGKQHEEPKQKERDNRKDKMILAQGLKVLRIKWSDFSNDPKFWIEKANSFTRL